VTSNEAAYATALCHVDVSGAEAARAELMFSFVPYSLFAPDYRDGVLDRFLGKPGASR
jgi:hypothetical protein